MGLGRADPVDGVPAAGEEHRDRQPRRPRGFKHHLQPSSRRRPLKSGLLGLGQAVHGRHGLAAAHHAAVASQHPHRVLADYPQVDPDQPPLVHRCLLAVVVCCSGGPTGDAPRPRSQGDGTATGTDDGSHSCAATGPSLNGPGHFPHPGHPWPAKGGNQSNGAWRLGAVPRAVLDATPGTNREAYATLGPRYGSSTGVPYMSRGLARPRQAPSG